MPPAKSEALFHAGAQKNRFKYNKKIYKEVF
jgi:hypothetical protein